MVSRFWRAGRWFVSCLVLCAAPVTAQYTWTLNPANGLEYTITAPMRWTQAESEAQRVGARLVTIRNQLEQDWLIQTFWSPSFYQLAIGFTDRVQEGVWQWTSGEPVRFTSWCQGEPNNSGNEDFGFLVMCGNGGWNDGPDGTAPAILERGSPPGWHRNPANGHWYRLSDPMTWTQAEALAVNNALQLATVRSQAEHDWLVQTFWDANTAPLLAIGYTDRALEGTWTWSSGEPFAFTNWCQNEPGTGAAEDFGYLAACGAGRWDARDGTGLVPAILEYAQGYTWTQNPANGHWYAITAPMTWTRAETEAQRASAQLVTIRNAAENDWIRQTFVAGSTTSVWIGLTDRTVEGVFEWASGEEFGFADWCSGEPSNTGNEDFVQFWGCGSSVRWNDYSGSANRPALLELISGASFTLYRESCDSSVGPSALRNLDLPRIGGTLRLEATGLGSNKAGFLVVGFQDRVWGAVALPFDLAAFGAPGCFMNTDPRVTRAITSDGLGVVRTSLSVPGDPAYVGGTFFCQVITMLDAPTGRALAVTATNAGRGIIGR